MSAVLRRRKERVRRIVKPANILAAFWMLEGEIKKRLRTFL